MKRNLLFVSLMLLAVSCSDDANNGNGQIKTNPDNFTEMTIPANFAWKMTTDVTCNFTSEGHMSMVFLYLPNSSDSFASFYVGKGIDPAIVNLPVVSSSVIVKYQKETELSAATTLSVSNGVITFDVPSDSKDMNSVANVAPMMTKGDIGKPVIYYPATGMGTMMFEDLWPYYGDYDFNDMAFNYRIQMNMSKYNKVNQLFITLRIASVGGSIPYDLYLQLNNVKGSQIGEAFKYIDKNSVNPTNIVQIKEGSYASEPALFRFDNIKENSKRPKGGSYLNTVKGYEISKSDMVEMSFFIDFGNGGTSFDIADMGLDAFNFFIARKDITNNKYTEIHLGGQKPSFLGGADYDHLKGLSSQSNKSTNFYYSNTNLVWGVNVPAEIDHAYEGIVFTYAYPEFAAWAQSAGAVNQDWYKHGETEHLVHK
ncbi:MAG: LruC domain-containing protein [Rikenellaceae bacterium]